MRIVFKLHFHSHWGEQVFLTGDNEAFGRWQTEKALPLRYTDEGTWTAETTINESGTIAYKYFINNDKDNSIRWEDKIIRKVAIDSETVIYDDIEHHASESGIIYSKVFTNAIFRPKKTKKRSKADARLTLQFRLHETQTADGFGFGIIGDKEALGLWHKPILLSNSAYPTWTADFNPDELGDEIQYKYVIINLNTNEIAEWEEGENHILKTSLEGQKQIVNDYGFHHKKCTWKGAGVAVPVFSLRSKDSFGIGEFHDLKKLADWCHAIGLKIIQILPINDTKTHGDWHDSYPYNAISAFALNPIYLNLNDLGIKPDATFQKLKTELNETDYVDYPKVLKTKWIYFEKTFKKQWAALKDTESYKLFFEANKNWLEPYARYCQERDGNSIEIHYFLQYHLDNQLRDAAEYLHGKGIALKGDIPIGVNPNSVDVTSLPQLFKCDCQAGAPPDAFAAEGQNWGFPTYNWDAMAKDGYQWWRQRLQTMARYFDAYRIDHILGFFRIWEIPKDAKSGLLGHFSPALPLSKQEIEAFGFHFDARKHVKSNQIDTLFIRDDNEKGKYHPRIALHSTKSFAALDDSQKDAISRLYEDYYYHRHEKLWEETALRRLPAITSATDMRVCGEDLGMIPTCVHEVLQSLDILSLEVQRMPKTFGACFVENDKVNPACVYTTGTHDMPTLRAWLLEDKRRASEFMNLLHLDSDEINTTTLRDIIALHLQSPSMWNIYPIQDLLDLWTPFQSANPKDDQINEPSDPHNKWKYRMRQDLETLSKTYGFNSLLKSMLHESNRDTTT